MLHKTLILAVFLILPLFLAGCDNDNNSSGGEGTALTENDFAADGSITVNPDKDHFVTFLERPIAGPRTSDTGESGTDIVLFEFDRTVTHTICWEDENEQAAHFMELFDSEGMEVLRVEANGECASAILEQGVYEAAFSHDGQSEESQPIFGIPQVEENDGELTFLERINEFITVLLSNFDMSDGSYAQTLQDCVNTLLSTKKCVACVLTGANLRGADLSGANLSHALVENADLRCSSSSCANLTMAILTGTHFSGSNFTGAILEGAEIDGTIFDEALWCDGTCFCGSNSTDECVGCSDISTCTGPGGS